MAIVNSIIINPNPNPNPNTPPPPPPPPIQYPQYCADFLNLSLSPPSSPSSTNPSPPFLPPSTHLLVQNPAPARPQQARVVGRARPRRVARRSSTKTLRPGKSETIRPPYPWATAKRATIHNLGYLIRKGLTAIRGRVQCKRCDRQYYLEYDLQNKFAEVAVFIIKNRDVMRQRAPSAWMNPILPDCKYCRQHNCVKPIPTKKNSINWLFLLLGQMVGCCKLSELKYFCKHTYNHRTGAKDRVLYLTYLELCRQLNPKGPSVDELLIGIH